MKSSKIITGVLIGAAAGAVLGILFAPEKGKDTREKLRRKGADLKDNLKGRINDLVDGITDEIENAKSQAENKMEEGMGKVSAAQSQIKHSLS